MPGHRAPLTPFVLAHSSLHSPQAWLCSLEAGTAANISLLALKVKDILRLPVRRPPVTLRPYKMSTNPLCPLRPMKIVKQGDRLLKEAQGLYEDNEDSMQSPDRTVAKDSITM